MVEVHENALHESAIQNKLVSLMKHVLDLSNALEIKIYGPSFESYEHRANPETKNLQLL